MHGFGLPLEKIAEVHAEDVHDTDAGSARLHRRERFQMRIVFVRGDEDEFPDARRLPRVQQIVERAVQRLSSERRVAREAVLGHDIDAVLERRRTQHAEFRGQLVGKVFDDDRVAAKRKMRSVLLAGAHRNDESRIRRDDGGDLVRPHFLDPARRRWGSR